MMWCFILFVKNIDILLKTQKLFQNFIIEKSPFLKIISLGNEIKNINFYPQYNVSHVNKMYQLSLNYQVMIDLFI